MSIESREIYPNASLQLVAFELRFPHTVKILSAECLGIFQDHLATELPLVESGIETGMAVNVPTGVQTMLPPNQFYKLISQDRMAAITIQQTALVVESTHYIKYSSFRALIERSLLALAAAVALPGITRTGLRYINEVRVPAEILRPQDWRAYLSKKLLEPVRVHSDFPASELMCRLQYDFGDGRRLTMNYGSFAEGEIVGSGGPLRVREKDVKSPFFLIDIDSFWVAPDNLETFLPESTLDLCDRLRTPAGDLFEVSITEELREQVLRKGATADEYLGAGFANQGA